MLWNVLPEIWTGPYLPPKIGLSDAVYSSAIHEYFRVDDFKEKVASRKRGSVGRWQAFMIHFIKDSNDMNVDPLIIYFFNIVYRMNVSVLKLYTLWVCWRAAEPSRGGGGGGGNKNRYTFGKMLFINHNCSFSVNEKYTLIHFLSLKVLFRCVTDFKKCLFVIEQKKTHFFVIEIKQKQGSFDDKVYSKYWKVWKAHQRIHVYFI